MTIINAPQCEAAPATLIYAVGDIHGRDDLLENLSARIAYDASKRLNPAPPLMVFLGDYIDRGPASREVLDRLSAGFDGFEVVCLMGNHEAMLLNCLEQDDDAVWMTWLMNGGIETLQSFDSGFDPTRFEPEGLKQLLGEDRIAWLRALKPYHLEADWLFVHAGIAPGKPLEDQQLKDLLWIRNRFLDSDLDHGFRVVHGHTPVDAPQLKPNRINIDTGAVYGGELTCVVLAGDAPPEFLSVASET